LHTFLASSLQGKTSFSILYFSFPYKYLLLVSYTCSQSVSRIPNLTLHLIGRRPVELELIGYLDLEFWTFLK